MQSPPWYAYESSLNVQSPPAGAFDVTGLDGSGGQPEALESGSNPDKKVTGLQRWRVPSWCHVFAPGYAMPGKVTEHQPPLRVPLREAEGLTQKGQA